MQFLRLLNFTKRQKFVLAVFFLSGGIFIAEFFSGASLLFLGLILSVLTVGFLFIILRDDIKGTFFAPLLILPFLYTLAFALFYLLVPARIISRVLITIVYAFGLYSLFLSQNIFAVSAIRTINLLRSARIVSFVITIFILFFLLNVTFSLRLPLPVMPFFIYAIVFVMNLQSLWTYALDAGVLSEILLYSAFISLVLTELSVVLSFWPVNATTYSIFLTGMFYTNSGLAHAWIEKRLFKGILWEYVWVGFLSILVLVVFSEWGI